MKISMLVVAFATAMAIAMAAGAAEPAPRPAPAAGAAGGPLAGGAPGQARRNYPVEAPGTVCPRAALKAVVDGYSAALAAHDAGRVKIAPNAMFTENGVQQAPGASALWKGAGAWGEQNYLLDTERCGAVTFGVINENGRLIHAAIRLQTQDGGAITEIEHVLGREKEFMYKPEVVMATRHLDWENILPPDDRQSRALMTAAATDYFAMFSEQPMVNAPFAVRCDRWENGIMTTPTHKCSPKGLVIKHPPPRVPLADVEAGLVAAFEHFAGNLADVHVFKMSDGRVDYAMAVVGPASPDPWLARVQK
ncbi:MAG: hypothetical protein ABIP38_13910 [Steroidobacteraceae bacterium]